MKLRERLPKLHIRKPQKYNHYRYHLFIKKEVFDKMVLTKIYNINIKDEVVDFDCNQEIIKKLDKEEVEYEKFDRVKSFFKKILIKQLFQLFF